MKRGYEVSRNFVRCKSTISEAFTIRHGGYSRANGDVFTNPALTDDRRGWIAANNIDRGTVIINDTDHMLIGNRIANRLSLRCGCVHATSSPQEAQAASRSILVGNTLSGSLELGSLSSMNHILDETGGGKVKGVKNYAAGIAQPSGANLVRSNVEAGIAGYEELMGNGGRTVPPFVTREELQNACGCDEV